MFIYCLFTLSFLSDVDECADNTHNCSKEGGLCINTKGSFNCTCQPGFTRDGHNCTGMYAFRSWTIASSLRFYLLLLKVPHVTPARITDGRPLQNATHHATPHHTTPRHATPRHATPRSRCKCKGCQWHNRYLRTIINHVFLDIDECSQGFNNNCSEHAHCNNTAGSYNCTCNEEYFGDGYNCNKSGKKNVASYNNDPWILPVKSI